MKSPKKKNYVLVKCNSFIKLPRQMIGFLITIYIQKHHSDSEEIIKYSKFQWRLLVIHKLMKSWMIGFMFTSHNNYITDALKQSISTIKQYFIFKFIVKISHWKYQLSKHCQSNWWISGCRYYLKIQWNKNKNKNQGGDIIRPLRKISWR